MSEQDPDEGEEELTVVPGRQSLNEREIAALSEGHSHCLVCYSDLVVRGKLPCGHDDICGVCHLRLRFLHDDKKCPICKQTNDRVIVDKDEGGKQFKDYSQWGDDIGAGFVFRNDVGMFFEELYFQQEIIPLFSYACNKCDFKIDETTKNTSKKNTPLRLLEDHLRSEHRLAMCRLCIEHKRDFISRLPRMTPNQLQHHLKKGDGHDSGFAGHPLCEFCRPKRFYDLHFLYQHLHKDHYKCHICEKQGRDNQFFKNYQSLERHFDQRHFLCHDVQCLSARFMVFENELDLRAHELSIHGGTSTGSTKINLEFRTRRAGYDGSGMEDQQAAPSDSDFNYDLDGQAFVPEALPRQAGNNVGTVANHATQRNSDVQLHPFHVQRTEELRAHAVAVRQQQAIEAQGESFPTLQASAAPAASAAPLVGWTTGAGLQKINRNAASIGRVTAEAFPSLPSSAAGGANSKKQAVRGNVGATRRQFAAMSTTAMQHENWSGNGHAGPSMLSSLALQPPPAAASSPSTVSLNRQSNLAADNFPELGPSTVARAYGTANAYATQRLKPPPPAINSASDFPSMGSSSGRATAMKPAAAPTPSMNSFLDFPAPPTASSSQQQLMRRQVLGNSRPQPRTEEILQVNMETATSAKATVEEMKASLGAKKYKELKKLTKEFALGQLAPEGYVDRSAALFDKGYVDADFWSYLSSLLQSCPNEEASQHAMRYMTSLRRQVYNQEPHPSLATKATLGAPSQWKESSNVLRNPVAAVSVNTPPVQRLQPSALFRPHTVASTKKSAWGSNAPATVVRAKASPGSVAVAAAAQGPQTGTATKFMAKELKKQANTSNSSNGKKNGGGKKKKPKDELRDLAFGR